MRKIHTDAFSFTLIESVVAFTQCIITISTACAVWFALAAILVFAYEYGCKSEDIYVHEKKSAIIRFLINFRKSEKIFHSLTQISTFTSICFFYLADFLMLAQQVHKLSNFFTVLFNFNQSVFGHNDDSLF